MSWSPAFNVASGTDQDRMETGYWTVFTLELLKSGLYSSDLCKITVRVHQTWHFRNYRKTGNYLEIAVYIARVWQSADI